MVIYWCKRGAWIIIVRVMSCFFRRFFVWDRTREWALWPSHLQILNLSYQTHWMERSLSPFYESGELTDIPTKFHNVEHMFCVSLISRNHPGKEPVSSLAWQNCQGEEGLILGLCSIHWIINKQHFRLSVWLPHGSYQGIMKPHSGNSTMLQ